MDIWKILAIEPTTDTKDIKRAYATQAALHHPEDEPEAFQTLREAYQQALVVAADHQTQSGAPHVLEPLPQNQEMENGFPESASPMSTPTPHIAAAVDPLPGEERHSFVAQETAAFTESSPLPPEGNEIDDDPYDSFGQPTAILVEVDGKSVSYLSFDGLNDYLDYVIQLCTTKDTFALTQLTTDPQFIAVRYNSYFMIQLYVQLISNHQNIRIDEINTLQKFYDEQEKKITGIAFGSDSQLQLVNYLRYLNRFYSSTEADFFQFHESRQKGASQQLRSYLEETYKSPILYTLTLSNSFKALDAFKVDYAAEYQPIIDIVRSDDFSQQNNHSTLLTALCNALFRSSYAGFVLSQADAKLIIAAVGGDATIHPSLPRALLVSQKNGIRKRLAYKKSKKLAGR